MLNSDKKILIAGAGGFGRDVLIALKTSFPDLRDAKEKFYFLDTAEFQARQPEVHDAQVLLDKDFDPDVFQVVVAIANPKIRSKIVEKLPPSTKYFSFTDPSAIVTEWVKVGEGSVITAGCILTTDIQIGKHAHLNVQTTIGHDCVIGDYFTTAPAVNVSGNCTIGNRVYIGTNAAVKQGVTIVDDVTIGMGAVVVKDILEHGVYAGVPARKLTKH